jgi:hypothetical protein
VPCSVEGVKLLHSVVQQVLSALLTPSSWTADFAHHIEAANEIHCTIVDEYETRVGVSVARIGSGSR